MLPQAARTRYKKINHNQPQSWGRYPKIHNSQTHTIYWQNELLDLSTYEQPILPYAYGRSYGDSCLNENGIAIDLTHLQRFISFDQQTGLLRCEAGVSLAEILDIFVPRGWFLPVTPGTKFVSVGGAIANDIHGKNHHRSGTFGCHVTNFELLRSNGQRLICSPEQNSELFRATIGGLGLTGIILWAEIRLKPIINPYIDMDSIRFSSLDEFFEISAESDQDFEYTMSWVDLLIGGQNLCRGIFMRGNHNQSQALASKPMKKRLPLALPVNLPTFTLNTLTVKAFNELYYHAQARKTVHKIIPYDPFFYPLDSIHNWNRMYGKRGFLQYQFVIPFEHVREAMRDILGRIRHSGEGSFLTVLKTFGNIPSPGMLSFPRPGLTLALDFAYRGQKTLRLLDELDNIIIQTSGALYPAKDARMSAHSFQTFYPQWKQFAQHIDPHFSSSFWRRVTNGSAEGYRPLPGLGMSPKTSFLSFCRRRRPVKKTQLEATQKKNVGATLAVAQKDTTMKTQKIMIIGATSAIAFETARYFAKNHDHLYLVARNPGKLQTIKNDLQIRGASRVETHQLDLNNIDQHQELIQTAIETLGGLDTVLISHGTLADQQLCQQSVTKTIEELTTNFTSVISLLTILANYFEQQRRGCIAVVSSVAGDRGRPSNYVYGTSKGAVTIFLQGLRSRLAKSGVTVLTIKPGLVDSPMTARRKKGPLFAQPGKVGKGVYKAINKHKNVVYIPWFWRPIMLVVKSIPEPLYKRLTL